MLPTTHESEAETTMSDREYTLDDLVRETGFSKRQIRFYITKRLVPGAGDSRGPHATYGEESLQRLLLIRDLKDRPVGPTGRTMTLDEIGHALDSFKIGSQDEVGLIGGGQAQMQFRGDPPDRIRDLVDEPAEDSAHDYLRSLRESSRLGIMASIVEEEMSTTPRLSMHELVYKRETHDPDLSDLLGRLQALLAELGSDTRFTPTAGEAGQWLRVTTPDVEFHVRKPDDHVARARLARLARDLARLLEREE
jgi:DNA-binding transcriptional MerR regulator